MDFGGGSRLTPVGCDAEQARLVRIRLVNMMERRNIPKDELRESLEMMGLAEPVGSGLSVPRDSYGRLRTDMVSTPAPDTEDAAEGEPGAVAGASRRHGDNGKCAAGDHPWIPENIRRNETTGRLRCRGCDQRRKRGPKKVKDPNAPVLCRCPGRKHVLTAETSESTYVDPRGQRLCRVGIDRRRQAERLLPAEQRTLLPGEKLCRCRPERHVLTPYNSDTTYVDADGHMRCRAVRRVREPNTEAAA